MIHPLDLWAHRVFGMHTGCSIHSVQRIAADVGKSIGHFHSGTSRDKRLVGASMRTRKWGSKNISISKFMALQTVRGSMFRGLLLLSGAMPFVRKDSSSRFDEPIIINCLGSELDTRNDLADFRFTKS